MRTIKIILWLILVLAVIAVGSVLVVTKLIDPNEFKPEISRFVEEKTGRELDLAGDLELTWFPWLGVETGALALSNAEGFGDESMIAADNVRVKVMLMPLLKKQLEIDTVVLDKPRIRLHTRADGSTNWDDLIAMAGANPGASGSGGQNAGAVAGLVVQGISVIDGQVWWQNDLSDQSLKLEDLDLSTGKLVPGAALDVDFSVDVSGNAVPEPATIKLDTTITVSENMESVALESTVLNLSMQSMGAELSIERLSYAVQAGLAAISGIAAEVENQGVKSSLAITSVNFNMSDQSIELPSLKIRQDNSVLDLSLRARSMMSEPAVSGKFEIKSDDIAALVKRNGFSMDGSPVDLKQVATRGMFEFENNIVRLDEFAMDAEINQLATKIETSAFSYDLATGSVSMPSLQMQQGDFNFAGKLEGSGLYPAPESMNVTGPDSMKLKGQIDVSIGEVGRLLTRNGFDLSLPEIPMENIRLNTSFTFANGALVADEFTADFDHHQQTTRITTPHLSVNSNSGNVDLPTMLIEQGDFTLSGSAQGRDVFAGLENMNFVGNLELQAGDVMDLLARNRVAVEIPEGLVKTISTNLNFELAHNDLVINKLDAKVDALTLTGQIAINDLSNPGYQFDLAIDQLDLDKLAESGGQSTNTEKLSTAEQLLLPVAPLRGIVIDGKMSIGRLITTGLTLDDVRLVVTSDKDVLRVDPLTARGFGGKIETRLTYDVSTDVPSISLVNNISEVEAGDLLKALEITDKLDGTGNLTTDLDGRGKSIDQLIGSLNGDMGFHLINGAIKGYDLQATLLKLESELARYQGKEDTHTSQPDAETKFAELSGTFQVQNGVFRNQDLKMKAPLFRVAGNGAIDLPNSRIDYKVAVNVVNSVEGQGGPSRSRRTI